MRFCTAIGHDAPGGIAQGFAGPVDEGKDRRWTFAIVRERLKALREQTVVVEGAEIRLKSTPDQEQQSLLDLLGVAL